MEEGCPKRMVYGPCGGVRTDLTCELGDRRCTFVDAPLPVWDGDLEPVQPWLADQPTDRPAIVTDLTLAPFDVARLRTIVGLAAPAADLLLVGEHQNRPDLPPTMMAAEIFAAGGVPWITLTGRDRNAVVLEQELAGLAVHGVPGVLCVTGDARSQGVRPDVAQVFDLDGTRLAARARDFGLAVAVAESPAAQPVALRPQRVASKQAAGARVCFLNHVSEAADVERFVRAAVAAGVTIPFVASVAVFTDRRSADVLMRFPGLALPEDRVREVLDSTDPVEAGIAAAVDEAQRLYAIPKVAGINVSGLASDAGLERAAEIKAEVGRRIMRRVG